MKINPESGCWEFTGCLRRGYGRTSINNITHSVHLVMYEHFKKKIKFGMVLRHKCDNKCCCNPYHLIQGTQKQNINDYHKRKK